MTSCNNVYLKGPHLPFKRATAVFSFSVLASCDAILWWIAYVYNLGVPVRTSSDNLMFEIFL